MILVGSYFKDVHAREGRERTPLGVNQGVLISSSGTIMKVEERRLEPTQPLRTGLLPRGIAGGPALMGAGLGGPAGDGGPLQMLMAGGDQRGSTRCPETSPSRAQPAVAPAIALMPRHRGAGTVDAGRKMLGHPLRPSPGSISAAQPTRVPWAPVDPLLSGIGDALDIFEPSS